MQNVAQVEYTGLGDCLDEAGNANITIKRDSGGTEFGKSEGKIGSKK